MAQQAVQRLTDAAHAFLDGLDDHQRRAARLPFEDEAERRDWHYIPRTRSGLALADMGTAERKLAHRLVASGLRAHAYAQVATIMALEDVLDELEGGGARRHHADYSATVFGEPGDGPWGWRFEGHHVSLNFTVDGGRLLAATPLFLGANPAVTAHRGTPVVRPLPEEEELPRALLDALSPALRERAVISGQAPDDILTGNAPEVDGQLEPPGVPAADLPGQAGELLRQLVDTYLSRLPEELASEPAARLDGDGYRQVQFAWAGPTTRGQGHYYRLQGPGFLVEYDNTQNGANHIHTVWRDPGRDFGADLLRRHRRAAHAPPPAG